MKLSLFTKATILLAILLAACQTGTPRVVSSPITSIPETSREGTLTQVSATPVFPTSTPEPEKVSPVLRLINLGETIGSARYSTDGKWLYVSSTTGVYGYDTTSYRDIRQISSIPRGKLSPDGKIIVTWNGTSLYAVDTDQKHIELERLPGFALTDKFFSADSSLIAQHYYDGTGNWFAIWRTADGKLINTFKAQYMQISTDNHLVAVQQNVQEIAGQESKPHVFLYDLLTGKKLGDWHGERPTFLSDNSLVMEADGYVYIFDSQNHAMRHRFAGRFAVFSSDEQIVAILSNDFINLYSVTDGKLFRKLKVDLSRISKLSPSGFLFSPDDQQILVHNQVLRTSDGSLVAELPPAFISSVTNLAFTPDGQQIIVASYDNLYLYPVAGEAIWIPEAGDPETYLPILKAASPRSIYGLSFNDLPVEEIHSPDGKFLAKNNQGIVTIRMTSGEGGSFTVPTEPETVALTYPTNGQRVTRVAFSADGHLAAFGLRAGSVELWNLDNQQKVFTIPPLVDVFNFVGGLAFSPDGKLLAIGLEDGTVRLYEINAK